MTPSATLLAAFLLGGQAFAQSEAVEGVESAPVDVSTTGEDASGPAPESAMEPEDSDEDEDPLSRHRTRFDLLAERTIGTASKPVAFNWRRTKVQVAATGSFPFELNNFNTLRAGGLLRLPSRRSIFEIGVLWAEVWDTTSSDLLALTPYRQPGRPSRLELDFTLAYPLAEGVVTASPRIFPSVQMVFNGYAELRYMVHPTGWGGMRPGQVIGAILSPSLTDIEVDNLNDHRLQAMQTDRGRYGLMVGFGNDLYFEQGIFVSPRLMMAVPILAPVSQTELLVWADFNLAIGVAF